MKTDQEFDIEEKEVKTLLTVGYSMKGQYNDVGK